MANGGREERASLHPRRHIIQVHVANHVRDESLPRATWLRVRTVTLSRRTFCGNNAILFCLGTSMHIDRRTVWHYPGTLFLARAAQADRAGPSSIACFVSVPGCARSSWCCAVRSKSRAW